MMSNRSNIENLSELQKIVTRANSTSKIPNYKSAEKMLQSYPSLTGYNDTKVIGLHSLLVAVKLIVDHFKFGEKNSLKFDAMNALLHELKICYAQDDHRHS